MIGIQFGVYEAMRKVMLQREIDEKMRKRNIQLEVYGTAEALEEAAMEVAASVEQPFPAPQFFRRKDAENKNNRAAFGVRS